MSTTKTTPPYKIPLTQIIINRQEGPADQCGQRIFTTYLDADAYLKGVCDAKDPKSPQYDKCQVTLCFTNGETYEFRFEASHPHARNHEKPALGNRVRKYLEFSAGLLCPHHLTEEQYQEQHQRILSTSPHHEQAALDWLRTYALSDIEAPHPKAVTEDDGRKAQSLGDAMGALATTVQPVADLSLGIAIQQVARTIGLMEQEVERLKADGKSYASMQNRALTVRKALAFLNTATNRNR